MPLQVVCPSCNAKLRAPDTAAGKKTKCPKCQAVISVPIDAPQAPAASPGAKKAENWHMQTTDGSQFGPVPRTELDEWFKEGRISADCQLLKEGADQWQWSSEIYPSLEQPAQATPPSKPAAGFNFLGPATLANNDPLGLGNSGLTSAPMQPALPSLGVPAPAFPMSTPSFGVAPAPSYGGSYGGGGYGGGYGAPANPYSSPSPASYGSSYGSSYGNHYGGQARSGLHPMVIIAAIIEFLYGGLYALGFVFLLIATIFGALSEATIALGNEPGTGTIVLVVIVALCLVSLVLSVLLISSGVGLLRRRYWAKITSIVVSSLFVLIQCITIVIDVLTMNPCSLVFALLGLALNATVLTAMCIPNCTSNFS